MTPSRQADLIREAQQRVLVIGLRTSSFRFPRSRHHRIHPEPRKPLAGTVKRTRSRGIVAGPPHVQVNLECGQLPTQKVQPNSHVHVVLPEIAHGWFEPFSVGAAEDWRAGSNRSDRQVSRRHAATRSDSASRVSRTALVSLRIWKACTTRINPRTTSDTPATMVSTTMESNGQTSTTPPAITDINPRTTYQLMPGKLRSLTAAAISDTPRKMNPVPIQSESSKTA